MTASYRFGAFSLDLARRELRRDGEPVELQPRVFAVLVLLVKNSGVALSKDDFLEQVWSGRFVTDNVLSRCIRELRRVLNDDASDPEYIRTVRGFGYQFIAQLDDTASASDQAAGPQMVAVLPFQPMLPEHANDALEIGLAHTLVTDLSRLADLVVRPIAAVRDAQAGNPSVCDPVSIGRLLNVDVIVEGNLQVSGERVRLSLRAIRVADGSALLSEQFEERLEELFDVQDRLCNKIIQSLALRLSEQESSQQLKRDTRHVGAYREYVNGRLKLAGHSEQAARQALAHFEKALHLDPNYSSALVGVAEVYDTLGSLGTRPQYFYQQMRTAAQEALRLSPQMARAHTCLGKVSWQYDWDWAAAENHFTRALELGPSDADNLVAYSDFLAFQGRHDEALATAERAGEINPFSPWIQAMITQALYMGERYQEAVEQGQRAVELAPDLGFSHLFLGLSLLQLEQYEPAIRLLQNAIDHSGRKDFLGVLGYALARVGDTGAATELLARMEKLRAAGEPIPPIAPALVNIGLGQFENAVRQFNEVIEQRSWHILLLHADPIFNQLRARPEGLALLQKCGVITPTPGA